MNAPTVATSVPDFSPRSHYLLPGQTPQDPVYLDIDKIAEDAMRRVQAAVEETTAEAGSMAAEAMKQTQKTAQDAGAKADEALRIAEEAINRASRARDFAAGEVPMPKKGNVDPAPVAPKAVPEGASWLAWLKKFLANLIRRVVSAVGQAFGVSASAADQVGGEGGAPQGEEVAGEPGMQMEGALDNRAVAGLALDEINSAVEALCNDPSLMKSLYEAESKGPEAFAEALRTMMERLEGQFKRLDDAVQLQQRVYEKCLENSATREMSALKMDSYIRQGGNAEALVPPAVLEEMKKLRSLQGSRDVLDRFTAALWASVKSGDASMLEKFPCVGAAIGRTKQSGDVAPQAGSSTGAAPSTFGVGPVDPAEKAAQLVQMTASTRPRFGSGKHRMAEEGPSAEESGVVDVDDDLSERPRG